MTGQEAPVEQEAAAADSSVPAAETASPAAETAVRDEPAEEAGTTSLDFCTDVLNYLEKA